MLFGDSGGHVASAGRHGQHCPVVRLTAGRRRVPEGGAWSWAELSAGWKAMEPVAGSGAQVLSVARQVPGKEAKGL